MMRRVGAKGGVLLGCAVAMLYAPILLSGQAAEAQLDKPAKLPAGAYQLDPNHASLIWQVSHLGLSKYAARFKKLSGTLQFDAANPERSSIEASIDVRSIQTPYPGTDKSFEDELAGATILDAAKFPTITFKSTKVVMTGSNAGTVAGDLTFHGVTKPVTLDVVFNGGLEKHPFTNKPVVGFSATGKIKRSDFGVTFLVGPISDDVDIAIQAEFQKP